MLKLNASYSKKVPAEGEYTSQSYHASVEVKLPDGLSGEALQARIHETFDLVRNSVEAELHEQKALISRDNFPRHESQNVVHVSLESKNSLDLNTVRNNVKMVRF